MAIVQGIREKVHLPIYDSLSVEAGKQLREAEPSSILRFFVNVQKKTKLETNLQSASLLPHYNTFEARAMRVVISDLPPKFPVEVNVEAKGLDVLNPRDRRIDSDGDIEGDATAPGVFEIAKVVTADIKNGLNRFMELLKEAREGEGFATIGLRDEGVTLRASNTALLGTSIDPIEAAGGAIPLSVAEMEKILKDQTGQDQPPKEQVVPGAGTIIGKLIYNTVTTFYVGEKIMIQMPTWFFPGGAGPYSEKVGVTTHGEPSPTATFRFAEPIFIDKQQNFRVEIEIPDTETLKQIQRIYGPMNLWVVLDGYMTRDVQ
ncbi:MAG TPA: hypothetical protein VF074_01415 [Pyrinomonadaceae bacterium]